MIIHNTDQRRREHDVYETPYNVAKSAVKRVGLPTWNTTYTVLDIGAGGGVWGKAFAEVHGDKHVIDGVDIRILPKPFYYNSWHHGDVTDDDIPDPTFHQYDIIIGNPPYKYAEECIRFGLSKRPKYMLMLLKLQFLETIGRGKGLWAEYPPHQIHVSMRRISFYDRVCSV
jgi:hypothetical protein